MTVSGKVAPWWVHVVAATFVVTLLFNARQEAFGPGPSGLLYSGLGADERPLFVEGLVADSPASRAGLRVGDVLRSVDGQAVLTQSDWFAVRAHFERKRRIPIEVLRDRAETRLTMTITEPNWRSLLRGDVVFQLTRPIVLSIALLIAYRRPFHPIARLLALLVATIAVGEAFPASGWAATLAHLPPFISLPIAWASTAWLVVTIPWLTLAVSFPRLALSRRWRWAPMLAPLALFVPLMILSSTAFIYQPVALAMPTPFLDNRAERLVHGIWGAMPGLMINVWPLYTPLRHERLIELWVVTSMAFWFAGCAVVVIKAMRERDARARRALRLSAGAIAVIWWLGVHNVLTRWGFWSRAGFAIEAAAVIALLVGFVIFTRRRVAEGSSGY